MRFPTETGVGCTNVVGGGGAIDGLAIQSITSTSTLEIDDEPAFPARHPLFLFSLFPSPPYS